MDPAIPTVAIHGVGRHEPGRIEAGVTATVERGRRYRLAVSEFNWDQRVDHRSIRSPEDALDNMAKVSASYLPAEEFHFIGLDMPPYRLSPNLPASVEAQRHPGVDAVSGDIDRPLLFSAARSSCRPGPATTRQSARSPTSIWAEGPARSVDTG